MPFWNFFRIGWDGRALLVGPSRTPHRNKKVFLFWVLMTPWKDWKAKLERPHFLKVQSGKITVLFTFLCIVYFICLLFCALFLLFIYLSVHCLFHLFHPPLKTWNLPHPWIWSGCPWMSCRNPKIKMITNKITNL